MFDVGDVKMPLNGMPYKISIYKKDPEFVSYDNKIVFLTLHVKSGNNT